MSTGTAYPRSAERVKTNAKTSAAQQSEQFAPNVLRGDAIIKWLQKDPGVWDSRPAYIDRATANKLLAFNIRNRPVVKTKMSVYHRDMEEGRFPATSSAIAFAVDSSLQNGQHRLHACAMSNAGFACTITKGLEIDSFYFEDVHIKRTLSDLLSIRGEKHYQLLAGAVSQLTRYITTFRIQNKDEPRYRLDSSGLPRKEREIDWLLDNSVRATNWEAIHNLEMYPGIRESVEAMAASHRGNFLLSRSIMAALHFIGVRANRELTEDFIEKIKTVRGIEEDEPVQALLRVYQSDIASRHPMDPTRKMRYALKALRLTLEGKKAKVLRIQGRELKDGKMIPAEPVVTIEDLVPENLRIK